MTTSILSPDLTNSLMAWCDLYMSIEAGPPKGATYRAKKGDLQSFLAYLHEAAGTDHPDQWTKSLTEGFLHYLSHDRAQAPNTVNRMLTTLKHAASWIHVQRPFLAGNPLERLRKVKTDDPDWRGLEDIHVTRLLSAAEQLTRINTRLNQHPVRDRAILLILLRTALRVSELTNLTYDQYRGKHLVNIKRKGNKVTRELLLAGVAREVLNQYIQERRGTEPGPLIQSQSGRKLAQQNVDEALKRIADQANIRLPADRKCHVSAHMLRHTALKRAADKYGVRFAMKLAGHVSSQYIWLYTQPSRQEQENAIEDLF